MDGHELLYECNSGNLRWVKLTLLFLQCTLACTAKNGVLDLHPLGCSTCHEHQAPLGVLTHTCWGVTMHSKVFENSNKRCIIYTCMHRYIGMQYDTNL